MNVNFPFQFNGAGGTADPLAAYLNQLVEQVLFTSPGERVNLPDFGSGVLQLVFAPTSAEIAAATQFTVQARCRNGLAARSRFCPWRPRPSIQRSPSQSRMRR
jgi:uncharacterized protein